LIRQYTKSGWHASSVSHRLFYLVANLLITIYGKSILQPLQYSTAICIAKPTYTLSSNFICLFPLSALTLSYKYSNVLLEINHLLVQIRLICDVFIIILINPKIMWHVS